MLDSHFLACDVDDAVEVAHVALKGLGGRAQVDMEVGLGFDLGHQLAQVLLHVGALERCAQGAEQAAELGLLLDQVHLEALLGQAQRRSHAGQAAAQDEGRGDHR